MTLVIGLGLATPAPASAQSLEEMTQRAMYESNYRSPSALFSDAEMERASKHYVKAHKLYEQAAQLYAFESDPRGEAMCLERSADMLLATEQPISARQRLERAYAVRSGLADLEGQLALLEQLGVLYLDADDSTRAIAAYEQLRKLYRESGNRQGEARTWLGTGLASQKAGREKAAKRDLKKALDEFRELGMERDSADVYRAQAAWARAEGRYEMAYGLDLSAAALLPEDQDLALSLIEDAIGAGRMPEALTRIDWLNKRSLDGLEAVQVRMSELLAYTVLQQPEQMRGAAAALSRAFSDLPATERDIPRLESVRHYLRKVKGMPESTRETLAGLVQVLSVAKTSLSQDILDTQLQVLTGSAFPLATSR